MESPGDVANKKMDVISITFKDFNCKIRFSANRRHNILHVMVQASNEQFFTILANKN
jgi:hypothetical protein